MVEKLFSSKNDVIHYIEDGLGSEGTHEIAEKIYDCLHSLDRIHYDDVCQIPDDLWEFAFEWSLV